MSFYEERVLLGDAAWLEARMQPDRGYRLCLRVAGEPLIEYWSEGAAHRRRVRGRVSPYNFRSIEQLRYDFERDAAHAVPRG